HRDTPPRCVSWWRALASGPRPGGYLGRFTAPGSRRFAGGGGIGASGPPGGPADERGEGGGEEQGHDEGSDRDPHRDGEAHLAQGGLSGEHQGGERAGQDKPRGPDRGTSVADGLGRGLPWAVP